VATVNGTLITVTSPAATGPGAVLTPISPDQASAVASPSRTRLPVDRLSAA
jgi:hypothetical protein